ncbi:hypothetical protein [Bradyrhizobium sp. JR3.5]
MNQIYIQASSQGDLSGAVEQVNHILTRRHNIRPGQPNDFSVRNLS